MEGLGISTVNASNKADKRSNGNAKLKGKQQVEPPTTYTVSKIDAGQAVLISDQIHCIEFPSILLPAGCTTGSVISISCTRNQKEERKRNDEFWDLQDEILATFGERSPAPPRLRLRNVTQTSVTLEWDKLDLATSKLLSLTIWRNGQRLAAIPNPLNNTSTKVSGLEVDAPYSFHLIMRTTAGTYASQTIKTRTLTLADTSGISVCFGSIDSPDLLDEAKEALTQMKARWSNRIQIETTHFVCTHPSGPAPAVTPPSDSPQEALDPGVAYQRASQLSIPIVQPAWILACLREKRMVPISAYTLDKATISGGPSSSVSLGKNTSSRSQHAPAQQPRNWPREPIQLQKPPPPKNSPDAAASPLPANEVAQQADTEIAPLPTSVQLAPTALSEGEPSAIEATKVESAEVAAADAESEPDPAEVGSAHPESTKVEDELQTTKSEAQAGSDSASQALSDKQISQLDDISISHAEEQGEETVVGVAEDSSSSKQADGAMPEAQQTDEPATELQNLGQDEGEDIDESSAVNTASETQEVTGLPEVTTPSDETSATAESTDSKDHQTPANDALEESPESKEENGKEEDASSDELEEVKL